MFDTRTLLARRRVVEPGYVGGPSFTERLNAPVQGMATDILKHSPSQTFGKIGISTLMPRAAYPSCNANVTAL